MLNDALAYSVLLSVMYTVGILSEKGVVNSFMFHRDRPADSAEKNLRRARAISSSVSAFR